MDTTYETTLVSLMASVYRTIHKVKRVWNTTTPKSVWKKANDLHLQPYRNIPPSVFSTEYGCDPINRKTARIGLRW